jgi:hypothetical protein
VTKNLKNFEAARKAVTALAEQLNTEAKADPRLARTRKRCNRLIALVDMAQKKYEVVHGRKVPAKVQERKAGVKKATPKKRVKKTAEVIELKTASAAARKRVAVKRSARK